MKRLHIINNEVDPNPYGNFVEYHDAKSHAEEQYKRGYEDAKEEFQMSLVEFLTSIECIDVQEIKSMSSDNPLDASRNNIQYTVDVDKITEVLTRKLDAEFIYKNPLMGSVVIRATRDPLTRKFDSFSELKQFQSK